MSMHTYIKKYININNYTYAYILCIHMNIQLLCTVAYLMLLMYQQYVHGISFEKA